MIGWLVACGAPEVADDADRPAEVRTWLEGEPTSGGGIVIRQVEHDADVEVSSGVPEIPGLSLRPYDEPHIERIGDRVVETRRYGFSGAPGHYEIPSWPVEWKRRSEHGTEPSPPLYVDIGVEPISAGPIEDITEPPRVWTNLVPWRALGAIGVATSAAFAGGLLVLHRYRTRPLPAIPPEAPDVVALRAWDAVRKDATLDDLAKASALSRIFREYTEAVLHFPCSKWTTTQTLTYLSGLPHLGEGNVPRAKRLLRATDRVKYAEARAGADVFEDLDSDLRAFVTATRPHTWQDR
jgi:hypothetical protein